MSKTKEITVEYCWQLSKEFKLAIPADMDKDDALYLLGEIADELRDLGRHDNYPVQVELEGDLVSVLKITLEDETFDDCYVRPPEALDA